MTGNLSRILSRIFCVSIYAYPFLETFCFFNIYLRSIGIHIPALEESAYFLKQYSWTHFAFFFVVIILQSRRFNLSYIVRYNLIQTLMLVFLSNLSDTCLYLFPMLITDYVFWYPLFNIISFLLLSLIVYCTIYAVRGIIPDIPFITEAIEMQLWVNEDD
jgi:hypothetical protein